MRQPAIGASPRILRLEPAGVPFEFRKVPAPGTPAEARSTLIGTGLSPPRDLGARAPHASARGRAASNDPEEREATWEVRETPGMPSKINLRARMSRYRPASRRTTREDDRAPSSPTGRGGPGGSSRAGRGLRSDAVVRPGPGFDPIDGSDRRESRQATRMLRSPLNPAGGVLVTPKTVMGEDRVASEKEMQPTSECAQVWR